MIEVDVQHRAHENHTLIQENLQVLTDLLLIEFVELLSDFVSLDSRQWRIRILPDPFVVQHGLSL